jgi:hypothetical protein
MRLSRRWGPVVGVVVLAALVAAGTSGRSSAGPRALARGGSLPVDSSALVCPDLSGDSVAPAVLTVAAVSHAAASSLTVTSTPLTGPGAKPSPLSVRPVTRVQSTTVSSGLVVAGQGPGAGGVVADVRRLIPRGRNRGLFSEPCLRAGTDSWITGADGRVGFTDTLIIANPGSTVANVTVTAWASTGRIVPPKLQAFTVAAGSTAQYRVANYTPDAAFVSLHVHANSGRVAAVVLDQRISGVQPAGIDWIPPTLPPSTDVVVPGLPAGHGPRRLIVANPGSTDATVSLRLATVTANFSPAGHPTVLVRAGHTAMVDLTTSLGARSGAAVLHSDVPVTAAAVSQATETGKRPDIQWMAASSGLTGPAALADSTPPFGNTVKLHLAAPGSAARLRITAVLSGKSQTVAVPAGRTLTFDPVVAFGTDAFGPLLFTPIGSGLVYASRMVYAPGAHGPLTTAEQPTLLPVPTSLPPVVADPRAALP